MIALDTNVLVRYIAQDDPAQSARATQLIEKNCTSDNPAFIGLITLVELIWVSESCYGATTSEIRGIVRRILTSKQLRVQDAEVAWRALRRFEQNSVDFADCLVLELAIHAGCERTVTFDKEAAKAGMDLL